jgi:hypothetical protein
MDGHPPQNGFCPKSTRTASKQALEWRTEPIASTIANVNKTGTNSFPYMRGCGNLLEKEILMNAISRQPDDEIEEALAYHQGDARATIAALLAERDFLLREIEYASLAMSYGFARGWKPGTGSARQSTAR